jgi:hypothetical protein
MKNIQLRTVNKAIASKGWSVELVKGNGYFYFIGDDASVCMFGVYVNSLNQLTLADWLDEAKAHIEIQRIEKSKTSVNSKLKEHTHGYQIHS